MKYLYLLVLCVALSACGGGGGGGGTTPDTPVTLEKIVVSSSFHSLPKGLTKELTAIGLYSDGTSEDITKTVTWSTSNSAVATCQSGDSGGQLTAVEVGTVTVTAVSGNTSDSMDIVISNAVLSTIEITPNLENIPRGYTVPFIATGIYSDSTTNDLTADVTWQSSNTSVATVSNSTGTTGQVTTLTAGPVTLTATLDGIHGDLPLTVVAVTLSGISVTPENLTLDKGLTRQYKATGVFSDSTMIDLTASVTWSSGNTAVASVVNSGITKGAVTAVSAGTTAIAAAINSVTGSASVTVADSQLNSIDITVSSSSLASGTTLQLTAVGSYQDGTTRDITASVVWASSDNAIATVGSVAPDNGLLTAIAEGQVTISAYLNGVVGDESITVTAATLTSLTVTPGNSTMPTGITESYKAVGHFSNGTDQDLTSTVTWSVDDTSVARISNLTGVKGLLTTFASGSVTITATTSTPAGDISDTASLTVTGATLEGLAIDPAYVCVETGQTMTVTLKGTFSDATVRDLTTQAVWVSADSSVASISNTSPNVGKLTGVAVGQTYIVAALGNLGVIAQVAVLKPVSTVTISTESTGIVVGLRALYTATAHYNDGTSEDVTRKIFWASSDTAVASLGDFGTLVGVGSGTVDVSVWVSGNKLDEDSIPVVADADANVLTLDMAYSNSQFTLWGNSATYHFNVTEGTTWSSGNESILTISNVAGLRGFATIYTTGTCNVTGVYKALSLTRSVSVTEAGK